MNTASPALIASLAFGLGLAFGATTRATNFCTLGAVTDIVAMGSWARMRMWWLAIAVAIVGTQALAAGGLIDLSKSFYTAPQLRWANHLVGGLAFGIGMPLASGCGAKMLVRLGGGNLKSLVVLVFFGLAAYMALRGVFAAARLAVLEPLAVGLPATQDLPAMLGISRVPLAAGVAAVLLAAILRAGALEKKVWVGGLAVGAAVVAGWWISGHLGYLAEDPNTLEEAFVATNSGRMESLSFAAPVAYLLEWLMLWTDASRTLTFGIAAVLGTISGASLHALATRSFRVESFANADDLLRHILGAVLMGAGSVTALGCTIGQGVTGMSTLAVGSLITLLAILAGCAAMLKFDEWRLMREPA